MDLKPKDWNRKDKNGNDIKFDEFANLHCHSFFSLLKIKID